MDGGIGGAWLSRVGALSNWGVESPEVLSRNVVGSDVGGVVGAPPAWLWQQLEPPSAQQLDPPFAQQLGVSTANGVVARD